MQTDIIDKKEDKDIILKFYRVTVLLEPITESSWYEMKREQQNLPAFSDANKLFCAFCFDELSPSLTYAKCLDCEQAEVFICIECLRTGMESHPHTRSHRYIFCDAIGPPTTFSNNNTKSSTWGAQEDLQLLTSLLRAHLNQWPELSKDWGRKRTLTDALERLDRCFIRDAIGQHVLKNYSRGHVKDWSDNENNIKYSIGTTTYNYNNLPSTSKNSSLTKEEVENEMDEKMNGENICKTASSNSLNFSTSSSTKKTYFDEEEESCEELLEQSNSSKEGNDNNNEIIKNGVPERKFRKEQLLAAAKNSNAAEVIRGKTRKTSLELIEATMNLDGNNGGELVNNNTCNKKNQKEKKEFLSSEQLALLYASSKFSPYFYNYPIPLMDANTVAKFDEEDLQLLTYLPYRDEFENEYKNEAEQLITQLSFAPENCDISETDKFLNEVNFARFNRYNRLMRIRAAKHAVLLEHRILAEYLNIVKTNLSEKGKYLVFSDRYFSTKSKEDAYRPIFGQLRQIADREMIDNLAKDIAGK